MFDTIKLKYHQGNKYIKDIRKAEIKSEFRGFPHINSEVGDIPNEDCCPSCALKYITKTNDTDTKEFEDKEKKILSIDMGKCTFCGKCKSSAIQFTNKYKLGSTSRDKLIITEDTDIEEYEKTAIKAREEIKKVFSKSLKLRQVSAGGCNGCEMELNACSNCNFDMGRYGIDFVASPKHADGIVITGPITQNMAYALEDCYKSTPNPKIVILAGACAISGGVFYNSDKLNREFLEKYPIDLYIPGCPIHPLTFINAVLSYITGKY